MRELAGNINDELSNGEVGNAGKFGDRPALLCGGHDISYQGFPVGGSSGGLKIMSGRG